MEAHKTRHFVCPTCGARIDEAEYDPHDQGGSWRCAYCGKTLPAGLFMEEA